MPTTKPKKIKPVVFRHRYLLSGPVVLENNETRVEVVAGQVTAATDTLVAALDKRTDFERKENA